jgi:hypothetical protein
MWARGLILSAWIVSAVVFLASIAGGDVAGIVLVVGSLPPLLFFAFVCTGSPRIRPGKGIGGGTLLRVVPLHTQEAVFFDAAVFFGSHLVAGHIIVTSERILLVPYRLWLGSIHVLRLDDVVDVVRGSYRWSGVSWGDVRIRSTNDELAVRGWSGADWMGAYDPNDLLRDVRAALARAGWQPRDQPLIP